MTWLCVMAVLAAAPETGEPPADAPQVEAAAEKPAEKAPDTPKKKKDLKLGAPTFAGANVKPEVINVASEHFAQQLSLQGLRVITSGEIAALLGLERQKQLLGCADDTGCIVELSNALGVDGIVTGSIGSFGGRYTVNVKVVGAGDGKQLGVFSATAESERGLPDVLSRAAQDIAKQVKVAVGWEEAPEVPVTVVQKGVTNRQKWAALPTSLAVLAFVGSGVLFGWADGNARKITDTTFPPTVAEVFSLVDDGRTMRTFGWVALGVGGALTATAAWLFFYGSEPRVEPVVTVGPTGFQVGLGGPLPW